MPAGRKAPPVKPGLGGGAQPGGRKKGSSVCISRAAGAVKAGNKEKTRHTF